MSFAVRLTREALDDLQQLEEFLVELASKHGDYDLPVRAIEAIRREFRILETNPHTCRKAGSNPLERELVIPFGGSGYVALFEMTSELEIVVSAIRHQREDDYH